mmetsp:Transcript_6406/g.25981  ORF Transcript_6406/g.25981 Transcript_6406/m.25981 type:complete len:231 (-) Transcript_6406:878-1570(-)
MIRSPPGCSGSQRLTSKTMPSTTTRTPPPRLCATTSFHACVVMRDSCAPKLARHASARLAKPSASAAPTSASAVCTSYSGRAKPRDSRSSQSRTLSNRSQSIGTRTEFVWSSSFFDEKDVDVVDERIVSFSVSFSFSRSPKAFSFSRSHCALLPLLSMPPGAASRTCLVSATHGRSSERCTGNVSPSLVTTAMVSFCNDAARLSESSRGFWFKTVKARCGRVSKPFPSSA